MLIFSFVKSIPSVRAEYVLAHILSFTVFIFLSNYGCSYLKLSVSSSCADLRNIEKDLFNPSSLLSEVFLNSSIWCRGADLDGIRNRIVHLNNKLDEEFIKYLETFRNCYNDRINTSEIEIFSMIDDIKRDFNFNKDSNSTIEWKVISMLDYMERGFNSTEPEFISTIDPIKNVFNSCKKCVISTTETNISIPEIRELTLEHSLKRVTVSSFGINLKKLENKILREMIEEYKYRLLNVF